MSGCANTALCDCFGRYRTRTRVPWSEGTQTTTAASTTRVNVIHSATHSEQVECGYVSTESTTANSMVVESSSEYQPPPRSLPLLVSACPGWVCYAEKTHPQTLPYLSSTKSPQQILGALVKRIFATALVSAGSVLPPVEEALRDFNAADTQKILFVSVQPCFDKKLEGSRLVCAPSIFNIVWKCVQFSIKFSFDSFIDRISRMMIGEPRKLTWSYQLPNAGTY